MNQPSILIVGDELKNFDITGTLLPDAKSRWFSHQGCVLHHVANGQEAIACLNALQPDVILLDVGMPGLNGLEVCRQIRTIPQCHAIPIIMVTALTAKEDLALCLEAGADDFISKPVSGIELRARIHSMLRIKHQYDDLQLFLERQTVLEAEKIELLEYRNMQLEQQVEDRTAILKATIAREQLISRIASQIQSSLHLQEILEMTVQEVRSHLGCTQTLIWQFQPNWSLFTVAKAVTSGLVIGLENQPYETFFAPDWVELHRQGCISVVADIYTTPMSACRQDLLEALQIRAKILVPIFQGERLWGLLSAAESHTPRQWRPEETTLLQQLATQLAIAIQNASLFEQVRSDRERLKTLSSRLIEAQEAERRHIAYELHDEIGQALTAVKINLQASQRSLGMAGDSYPIQESIAIVEEALHQVRNLALDLRPSLLDDLGLLAALRWYLDRLSQRTGLAINLVCGAFEFALPPKLETVCFRIVQEALTNITKHARAASIMVQVKQQGDKLQLSIRDDGVGFDVPAARHRAARGASLGLLGMEERAALMGGQLHIRSLPGQGTEIHVHFLIQYAVMSST
ncbi:MAG: response regulator [Oscillatoriophycideae cyanobacterium NC_groundwater_1537_Pr4_S-0.65um_50_18]|nr:response regulator [Oscillatoriophycideae cyanobacterium NC_groundwater_1537_Pr4_S-0.65um_50_18]